MSPKFPLSFPSKRIPNSPVNGYYISNKKLGFVEKVGRFAYYIRIFCGRMVGSSPQGTAPFEWSSRAIQRISADAVRRTLPSCLARDRGSIRVNMVSVTPTNVFVHILLQMMAFNFNFRPSLRKHLKWTEGWIDFSIAFRTEDGSTAQTIIFKKGIVRVVSRVARRVDASVVYENDAAVYEMITGSPDKVLRMLLHNKIHLEGNHLVVLLFNYLMSLILDGLQITGKPDDKTAPAKGITVGPTTWKQPEKRKKLRRKIVNTDPGVKYLDDPGLPEYGLEDFPRLEKFLDIHFNKKPELCPERPKLLTDWFMKNGFEKKRNGEPWIPEERQSLAFKYLMENKRPIIRKDDLIAGTTTTSEIGAVIYPDSQGMLIWPELRTMGEREHNPCDISRETRRILHHHVFPYWLRRNIKLWVGDNYDSPLCEQIGDRYAVYILSKAVALSHTIADIPRMLRLGTGGIIKSIHQELADDGGADEQKKYTLQAMINCLEGVDAYALNLSRQAAAEAAAESDPGRRAELELLTKICAKVPMNPPETLDEAVNSIWIGWVALHMENTNIGLSLGRMDQWLQPYFEKDMAKLRTKAARKAFIKHAIELVGCFHMRCTDHIPLSPDAGKYIVGGAPANQAITLGGITPDGKDAVNDMTYIFLKATEMLGSRDPNVNARYHPGINTDAYLKRLCEVNLVTAATPSMHNDAAVMKSLEQFTDVIEDARDWSATGCVEPTLSGKHIGHTGCMMMNMVAAVELAMNNGRHPLMRWDVGPKTGSIEDGDFETFEDFFRAFEIQFKFLIDNAVMYNNYLGESHAVIRPTPLLSSLIDGSIEKGKDVTKGGALYNSSGIACIGLTDVTDSFMSIKKFVFDDKKVTFEELKKAIDTNFQSDPVLHAMIMKKSPRFGSGSEEAIEIANRITKFTHDTFAAHRNFRGGAYTSGFWSMSNHLQFGSLTGALPSGRLAGNAFTPGLTPEPTASKNLLDNMHDVARLDPRNMNNNIAFNVKVIPAAGDSHEKAVEDIFSYVKTYFDLGGMQIQLNVVTTEILRDAMAHPENYTNLLVRISGYNAYFTTLTREMQMELIERAEFGL